jgi:quinol-cytochrome oxidoreductase complex cytochrome b subunit
MRRARRLDGEFMSQSWNAVRSWVDTRLGVSDMLAFARKKTVPVHRHSFWYYWGGMSLFLFLVQGISGVLLLIYYRPGPDAYESVRQITFEINFGWLIRSVHSWSANLMVAAIFVHMFSVFFMKAYRAPREFGWFTGIALLGLTLVFGFSGYLLPMNELAFFATKVGLQMPSMIPVVGPIVGDLARGGPDVNEYTVQRFFALHAVILPALFIPLLALHLWLVQKHGNAVPPSEEQVPPERRRSVPFFPNFLLKDMAVWLIALNVLTLLAALFPWDLGSAADPLKSAPPGIHPEWYFMSAFQTLKSFGNWFPGASGEAIGMITFNVGLALWFLIPLFDGNTKSGRRGRLATYFGLIVLGLLMLTTIGAYVEL